MFHVEIAKPFKKVPGDVLIELRERLLEIGRTLGTLPVGSNLWSSLEASGMISREVPPDNRRVIYGRITEAGLDALGRARGIFMAGLDDAFSRRMSCSRVRSKGRQQ